MRLTFASKKNLDALLATKCIDPPPSVKEGGEVAPGGKSGGNADDDDNARFSFGVEAKVTMTSGSGEAVSATVESVNILSSTAKDQVLQLETQIILRVARLEDDGKLDNGSLDGVRLNLEIAAVLSEKSEIEDRDMAASVGLRALYLGRYADMGKTSARRVSHNRLSPLVLQVKLSQALNIKARSISGPNIGETLVSLVISHSNTHNQDVLVTNLALHPAFSRSVKTGGQSDQSGAVQWGFAHGAHLKMPLTIRPSQAHATILHILGSSETGQAYISPLSVTASLKQGSATAKSVVAAVDVEWESASQVPNNSSDALRVDVTAEQDCHVGVPFSVNLRVQNLGKNNASNLKVRIPRGSTKKNKDFAIFGAAEAVVLDANGDDLLELDDAVPLGEIRSRESTETELRFLISAPGIFKVPHFLIFDGDSGRSFQCVHNVQVVATK